MKNLVMIAILVGSIFTMAGDRISQNEDVQFIRDFQKSERAAELASVLALDASQIETLKAIKADVDAIKDESEAARTEFEARAAATAAAIRADIEATGELSDANQEAMKELKAERRQLGADTGTRLKAATIGLRDLLTDEQKAALGEHMQSQRAQRMAMREDGEPMMRSKHQYRSREGAKGREGKGRERGRDRTERKLARILLSDAFINALDGE